MLRWFALAWLIALPTELPEPLPTEPAALPESPEVISAQPLTPPQDLEQLERNRVITREERDSLETETLTVPADLPPVAAPKLDAACREGALSWKECTSGLLQPSRSRRGTVRVRINGREAANDETASRTGRSQPPSSTPLTVPVTSLNAGSKASFRLESVFAVTPRPSAAQGNGDRSLLFPVLGEAFSSSGFGWRLHPVLGIWRMHAGRDFAAPEGAPVVAALSGSVLSSGLAGGYGIAVELEHSNPRRRTLYGHLSEIYVRPGQRVRQGEVIGRVGSTGLSTGPHLHFELRRSNDSGWIAVDPTDLDGLRPSLETDVPLSEDAVSTLMAQVLKTLERPGSALRSSRPAG